MMLAVVGSRNCHNYEVIEKHILQWEKDQDIIAHTIVSGGAKGVDTLAKRFSDEHSRHFICYKPDYSKWPGKIAPIKRNSQIVATAEYLIAFPTDSSKGTWDSVGKAQLKGIPTTIIKVVE